MVLKKPLVSLGIRKFNIVSCSIDAVGKEPWEARETTYFIVLANNRVTVGSSSHDHVSLTAIPCTSRCSDGENALMALRKHRVTVGGMLKL